MYVGFEDEYPQQYVTVPCDKLRAIDHCVEDLVAMTEDQIGIMRDIASIARDLRNEIRPIVER